MERIFKGDSSTNDYEGSFNFSGNWPKFCFVFFLKAEEIGHLHSSVAIVDDRRQTTLNKFT